MNTQQVYPVIPDAEKLPSPCLWVDRAVVKENLKQMISETGGAEQAKTRLRPHLKTHKMGEIVALQAQSGITKCKVATTREALLAAENGATDILIAHQLVGPKMAEVKGFMERFPALRFSSLVDSVETLAVLAAALDKPGRPFPLWIDVDCGMHRSGIAFGDRLDALRDALEINKKVAFAGLHLYDGHIREPDPEKRRGQVLEIIESVKRHLSRRPVPAVVGGGSISFGTWAGDTAWECSPGTTALWDCGYGDNYPDLRYRVAAGLVTRIISKPGTDLCFDLGHKAVAAEMPLDRRLIFPEIPGAQLIAQSEEHLVVRVPDPGRYAIGEAFTAIPRHICPTVALHARACLLDHGKWTGQVWEVSRDR